LKLSVKVAELERARKVEEDAYMAAMAKVSIFRAENPGSNRTAVTASTRPPSIE
tara:strand:+ start:3370 stop:3531 length:162 start_codon:yes stop_codon:yes gene_type:complete